MVDCIEEQIDQLAVRLVPKTKEDALVTGGLLLYPEVSGYVYTVPFFKFSRQNVPLYLSQKRILVFVYIKKVNVVRDLLRHYVIINPGVHVLLEHR